MGTGFGVRGWPRDVECCLLAANFDLDVGRRWRSSGRDSYGNQRGRRTDRRVPLNLRRQAVLLLLAVLLDEAAQVVGIKLIGERNRSNRGARLQARGDHLRLKFGCMPAACSGRQCRQ